MLMNYVEGIKIIESGLREEKCCLLKKKRTAINKRILVRYLLVKFRIRKKNLTTREACNF